MPEQEPITYSFLVGSYPENPDQGIYLLEFSPETFGLQSKLIKDSIQGPSFVMADRKAEKVFAVEEVASEEGGKINLLQWNSEGKLEILDTKRTVGDYPCYLALAPDQNYITVGNYSGGKVSLFKVNGDNLEFIQDVTQAGSSVNKDRQESSHVHSTVFNPDGTSLLVADLGTDEVYAYSFDPSKDQPLTLLHVNQMEPGDGPRHIEFSPDGKEVAVIQELTGVLTTFSLDKGELKLKQRLSILDEGFDGGIGSAEVHYSPDGRNLYASNRGDANSITVFKRADDDTLEKVQYIGSGGIMPRNFNLTKDGKFLLAANQASHDVVVFERDPESGKLTLTDFKTEIFAPVYLFAL